MMKQNLLLTLFCCLFSVAAFAKEVVKGTVKDAQTGEEVIGANVLLEGTTYGASTDVFGNFEFSAPKGTYNIVVSYIGYKDYKKSIELGSGGLVVNIQLESDLVQLEGVVVQSKADRASEEALLLERQKSTTMVEAIGVEELATKGVSNVEEGVAKMVGISKESNRGLYVRGLGDRYNNALLNGLPVPSPNPNTKIIPLNLFSADIVKNISISKVFDPHYTGDFAGASINVVTKDYPADPFLNVSVSSGYNSISTGKDFRSSKDGAYEKLGFSGDGRQLPDEIRNAKIWTSDGEGKPEPFSTNFDAPIGSAPIDFGVGIAGGKLFDLAGSSSLGVLFSVNYDNEYRTEEGVFKSVNAQDDVQEDYTYLKNKYNTNTSALLNLYYRINSNHKISYNSLFVNSSENEYGQWDGEDFDRGFLRVQRIRYIQNQLWTNQLLGSHVLSVDESWTLDWAGSYSIATSDEPDRRQLTFQTNENFDNYLLNSLNASDNQRYWGELSEDEWATKVEVKKGFSPKENMGEFNHYITFGLNSQSKARDFEWRQVNIQDVEKLMSDPRYENGVNPDKPSDYINDENYSDGLYFYKDQPDPSRIFKANVDVASTYLIGDFTLVPDRLSMQAGVRAEQTNRVVKFKKLRDLIDAPLRESTYEDLAVLPSVNFKYNLNEKSSLKLAASKTLTRPSLLEVVPFIYVGPEGQSTGNDTLANSQNYNFDLKYELFPEVGSIVAIGGFVRYINDAVEMIVTPESGTTLYSFANTDNATVAGLELEFNRELGKFFGDNPTLNKFSLGANFTYLLVNEIQLKEKGVMTNDKRALQGASPYLVNANMSFNEDIGKLNTTFAIVYNTFGRRLFAAGAQNNGDIFEKPVHTLDLVWRNSINDRLSVNLSVKNLLDPTYEREQESVLEGGQNTVVYSYKKGISAGLSMSYKF
ncbi:TonB-dependent receptor [Aureibacter tunicatorum]|uniref:TonB-dependent receptor n=1 Tax=Aureibacter tunicatorum TaxID=866807 RepID=A0AAE3XJ95_9BACT|nr:TonB-dependent receptor [Aureibacter tunicatorum]MDR6237164.1 TonB-dependent receptor [Aureibacter tunicatorum]BDD06156.1 TonB-dependent receptor [Aureibacter tunicatorum]